MQVRRRVEVTNETEVPEKVTIDMQELERGVDKSTKGRNVEMDNSTHIATNENAPNSTHRDANKSTPNSAT